jgi:hypothetical protein
MAPFSYAPRGDNDRDGERQMMRPDINWIEVKRQLSCRDRQETGDVGILEREMRCPPCCCPR